MADPPQNLSPGITNPQDFSPGKNDNPALAGGWVGSNWYIDSAHFRGLLEDVSIPSLNSWA